MTDDGTALRELLAKGTDASLLREMIGFAAERLMGLEADGRAGAAYGERSPDCLAQRNGHRKRDWGDAGGQRRAAHPKAPARLLLPVFPGSPSFLAPCRMAGKALTAVGPGAYVQGVSTRAVDDLVWAMAASGVGKSQVSRLCAELDAELV